MEGNHKKQFCAGAAIGNITPSKAVMPLPLIWGIRFTKVNDPLHVRALAMSDGDHKNLFIAFEMTLVPYPEETLQFLTDATGIPKERIFLTATHTHGVTPLSMGLYKDDSAAEKKCRRYYQEILPVLKFTVEKALDGMLPAKYGYGTGISDVNVNRDCEVAPGKWDLNNNYERESDKTLRMVRFETLDGEMIALLVNYACHCTVMNGCIEPVLTTPVSADLAGRTCTKLEEQMPGGVVIWCSGASGDQAPKMGAQCWAKNKNGKLVRKSFGGKARILLEYLSDEHARDIKLANQSIICNETSANIEVAESIALAEAAAVNEPMVPYVLRLMMIGDIALQGISAEIVTSVGKQVRAVSPYEKTILVSHTSGYQGYIADDFEYDHKCFEAGNSKTKKGTAEKAIVDGFKKMFDESHR